MGYPMAKNLRAGLGKETRLLICDVNAEALDRFIQEAEGMGPVNIVKNGSEAVQAAVRRSRHTLTRDLIEAYLRVASEHRHNHAPRFHCR